MKSGKKGLKGIWGMSGKLVLNTYLDSYFLSSFGASILDIP